MLHAVQTNPATSSDRDSDIREKVAGFLKTITNHDFGQDAEKWHGWWVDNKASLEVKLAPTAKTSQLQKNRGRLIIGDKEKHEIRFGIINMPAHSSYEATKKSFLYIDNEEIKINEEKPTFKGAPITKRLALLNNRTTLLIDVGNEERHLLEINYVSPAMLGSSVETFIIKDNGVILHGDAKVIVKEKKVLLVIAGISCVVLLIYLSSLYLDAQSDKARMKDLNSHLQQYISLKDANRNSLTRTHRGGVTIIDTDTREYYPQFVSELSTSNKTHDMYARNSKEVKTIVFLSHDFIPVASYTGGINISGAESDDPLYSMYKSGGNSLQVAKEVINLWMVDYEEQSLIARTVIEAPSPVMPRKISLFKKVGDSYFLLLAEGKESEYAYDSEWSIIYRNNVPCCVSVKKNTGFKGRINNWIQEHYAKNP